MTIRFETKRASELTPEHREAWAHFLSASPKLSSPYFGLGFLDAVSTVRSDAEVAIQRRGGEIEAMIPFHRGFLGHARPLGGPLGDHQALISPPGTAVDLQALFGSSGISAFDFHGVLGVQPAFKRYGQIADGSWVVDLSAGYDAFIARQKKLGGNTFRTISKAPDKVMARVGEPVFRFDDTRPEALDALFAWKSDQYRASGHFDVFSVDWTRALLMRLLASEAEDCRAVLSSLEADGRIIAVHLGMIGPRALHYWFPAYDPELAKCAPGNALLMAICEHLANEGVGELHLGPGDFRYKAAMGSWQIPLRVGSVTRAAPTGLAIQAAQLIEQIAEAAPLGRFSRWPGKAFRRIDQIAGFRATC
ncbi:MAG: GNAT family N-acetyltransferase [Pseudomonadota bacterium]